MNKQIVKLFAFTMILFGVLVGFTSYWSVFNAEALKEKDANKRPLLEQQQIKRGRILTADGTVIARSVPKGSGANLRYVRRYPEGSLFGHPIGYSFVRLGDTEFEQFHNDQLVGNDSEFISILDELSGKEQEGNDIVTNIDGDAQEVALNALEAQGLGAVVALEPSTGKVKVMASNAPYDPNRIPYPKDFNALNDNEFESPLLNRATQSRYPPGSTFKVVTAAAALDSGTITPDTPIDAPGSLDVQGLPLENDFGTSYSGLTLDSALTNSVNTYFAQVGEKVGEDTLFEYMDKFGFNTTPAIDLPSDELAVSGIVDLEAEEVLDPERPDRHRPGRDRPGAPAGDAAADGPGRRRGRQRGQPDEAADLEPGDRSRRPRHRGARPLRVQPADQRGVGRRADHRDGRRRQRRHRHQRGDLRVAVAGKTGTAETPGNASCGGGEDENQAWFIGFAPADDPEIAIAASVECTPEFGGDVAAPIFREVAEAILQSE